MNTNKENINRMPATSKIPLPQDPLPALSENILKKVRSGESDRRPPLKTINNQPNLVGSAGPSNKTKKNLYKAKFYTMQPLKLDTRHVTLRQNGEDLDWDYKVFKDKSPEEKTKDNSITSVSDEENQNIQNNYKCTKSNQRVGLQELRKNATPVLHSLEPIGVRNVKKSLKRPHSRELQGLPSANKQERENEKHARRFSVADRLHDRLKSPDIFKKLYMTCLSRDYTSDMFMYLLSAEDKPMIPRIASVTRACVINWLMKVNGADGDPTTVQTACWYLDAVLSVGYVQLDNLQLVAAACYWISQKLHGPAVQASWLVKCAKRAFSAEQLVAAEKAVMKKLKFPRHPVVSQDFISYLSWCCDNDHPGEIEVAATFLCMSGVMVDRKLCEEYPSVIAAAAVWNALLLLRKKDLMQRLLTCSVFIEIQKKSANMSFVGSVQRKAVRLVCVPSYQYKAPLEHYGCAPHYIAQRVVKASKDLTRFQGYNEKNLGSVSSANTMNCL